jgi:hypothetical protein
MEGIQSNGETMIYSPKSCIVKFYRKPKGSYQDLINCIDDLGKYKRDKKDVQK